MNAKLIKVPAGLRFADLELEREPGTDRLLFRPEPLLELARANQFDQQTMFDSEDVACWLIAEFYLAHRTNGGATDEVAEHILAHIASIQLSGLRTSTRSRPTSLGSRKIVPAFENGDPA